MIKQMNRPARLFSQSIQATLSYKLRGFFCVLSVALGIAAITIIVAATEGAYHKAFEIVDKFGPDSVMIIGGRMESRATGNMEKTLTLADLSAIKKSFSDAYVVFPIVGIGPSRISYKNKKYTTHLVGTGSNYSTAWSWPIVQGRDFTEKDITEMKNVGIIGQYLARELFGEKSPVGKYLFLKGIPVQIIGILQESGMTPKGMNLDNRFIIPATTAMKKIQNENKYISAIKIRFVNQSNLNFYAKDLEIFLRKRHKILQGNSNDFIIISPKEIIKFLVALTGSLILFIGISGIISLLVAGFVLANLFLLSVKQRSMEIGIRRSLGARQNDILFQFLEESVILTTTGGIFGFILGIVSSKLLSLVANFPIHFSWKAFVIGLVLSWMVGIFFGLQPSLAAARLNPVEAIKK